MNNGIFRKSSLERVESPEQLNDYIHCVTPSVWVVLGAIMALLIGVLIWAVFGRIDGVSPIYFILH